MGHRSEGRQDKSFSVIKSAVDIFVVIRRFPFAIIVTIKAYTKKPSFRRKESDFMQDRYAGDIGDYGKIGLLRILQAHGLLVAVNWYRVDPLEIEKRDDGTFKQDDGKFLIPDDLRVCDKELADTLFRIAMSKYRSVEVLEQANLIPGACYFHELLKADNRDEWHRRAMEKLKGSDIVFLDPDNGLLVTSVGKMSARSVKYTFYEEVGDYFRRGQSVLIYNHRSRKQESVYFHEICSRLQETTGVPESEILKITFPRRSVRDYLAVPASEEHRRIIEETFTAMEKSVWGRKGMCAVSRP